MPLRKYRKFFCKNNGNIVNVLDDFLSLQSNQLKYHHYVFVQEKKKNCIKKSYGLLNKPSIWHIMIVSLSLN